MKEEIGKRVEGIRKGLRMSQVQFGKMIGISGQYLGTVEKGTNGLSIEAIAKLCEQTGISADYILFGIDDPFRKIEVASSLAGISQEQLQIALEIIKKIAALVKTDNGNEMLIQEVLSQQK